MRCFWTDTPYLLGSHWIGSLLVMSPREACERDVAGTVWCCESQRVRSKIRWQNVLVIRVEKSRPEMMSTLLPVDFFRTILKPVGQSHVAMSKVDRIVAATFL